LNAILRNFLSLAVGRYVAMAVGALVTFVLARALGVESYGSFIAVLAASELFAAFLDLGLTRILVKEGAADRERVGAHLFNILLVKGVLAALVMVAIHFYALREGWLSPLYRLMILLALCKVADNFSLTFDGVFQVFQRMEFSAVILVAGRLGLLAAVLAGWAGEETILYYGWVYFGVSFATALATVLVTNLRFTRPKRGDIPLRVTVGREGLFFALSSLLYMAGTRLDVLALKEWAAGPAVGIYAAAARVMLVFQILPMVTQTSVLPELFRLGRHDRAGLRPFYAGYLQRSLILACFPFLWALFFPGAIIGTLFGAAFLDAAPWLRLLAVLVVLRFTVLAAGNVLTALDRQWERTIWAACGVGTTATLLVLLVPDQGLRGCVTALLTGEILSAGLNLAAAARLGYRPPAGPLARVLGGGALAAAVLAGAVRLLPWHLFAGLGGFLLSLLLTGGVTAAALLLTRAARLGELAALLPRGGRPDGDSR